MGGSSSQIIVRLHDANEQKLQSQGFKKINFDLNKGAGGKPSYLWCKKEPDSDPITNVQLTFNVQMSVGLIKAGYKFAGSINAAEGVDPIYIWYIQGSTEYYTPIVDFVITEDGENAVLMFQQGWEKLTCNLNRKAGGEGVYAWVKREKQTYICDVAATDSFTSDEEYFRKGYIRMDEDAHRGAGSAFVFIWYRQTTDPDRALSDLQVSATESDFLDLQLKDYQPVALNFNKWTGGIPIYVWYKREISNCPIKAMDLLLNMDDVTPYENGGIKVIKTSLNTGSKGRPEYLCFYQ